jgi:hypothetical protein
VLSVIAMIVSIGVMLYNTSHSEKMNREIMINNNKMTNEIMINNNKIEIAKLKYQVYNNDMSNFNQQGKDIISSLTFIGSKLSLRESTCHDATSSYENKETQLLSIKTELFDKYNTVVMPIRYADKIFSKKVFQGMLKVLHDTENDSLSFIDCNAKIITSEDVKKTAMDVNKDIWDITQQRKKGIKNIYDSISKND